MDISAFIGRKCWRVQMASRSFHVCWDEVTNNINSWQWCENWYTDEEWGYGQIPGGKLKCDTKTKQPSEILCHVEIFYLISFYSSYIDFCFFNLTQSSYSRFLLKCWCFFITSVLGNIQECLHWRCSRPNKRFLWMAQSVQTWFVQWVTQDDLWRST